LVSVCAAIGDDESSDIFGKSASSASSIGVNSTGTSEGVDSAFGSGTSSFGHNRVSHRSSAEGLLLQHASQVLSGCLYVEALSIASLGVDNQGCIAVILTVDDSID